MQTGQGVDANGDPAETIVGRLPVPGSLGEFQPVYGPASWDEDGDGFLGAGERALALNGHRWIGGSMRGAIQGYNLLGKASRFEYWTWPKHRIWMSNALSLGSIAFSAPGADPSGISCLVTWEPAGPWHLDPEATLTLTLVLERLDGTVTTGIPLEDMNGVPVGAKVRYDQGAVSFSIPAGTGDGFYRVKIVKDGDPETGGFSNQAYVSP
jgi:hypothetical protein